MGEEVRVLKAVIGVLLLWLVAIAVTLLVVQDESDLTYLLPVLAICTIGSVVLIRREINR
jgi:uncharacterized membrane-anchored protein